MDKNEKALDALTDAVDDTSSTGRKTFVDRAHEENLEEAALKVLQNVLEGLGHSVRDRLLAAKLVLERTAPTLKAVNYNDQRSVTVIYQSPYNQDLAEIAKGRTKKVINAATGDSNTVKTVHTEPGPGGIITQPS